MDADGRSAIREPLQKLLARVPQGNHPLIGQAYHLASASHEGQCRDEGQPYITHPVAVALILASELGFSKDAELIAAALLHDAVEDTALSLDDITPTFGRTVADLVKGVTKGGAGTRSRAARRATTLQVLFTAAHQDPRVLILKLSDRMHNMRSIDALKDPKRRYRIAQETADVYAPVSHLLGMGRIRRELENLSLSCLEPEVYEELAEAMDTTPPRYFLESQQEIKKVLTAQGIRVRTGLQMKSLTSIYRKVIENRVPIVEIYDRYSIRLIVSNRDACYRALGAIHGHFVPVMEFFKDFIALPKRNRYQALHTTVLHRGTRFEVHIQTPSMYRLGELGVATLGGDKLQEERRERWLQELSDWQQYATEDRSLREIKRILFVQEIAVFTPKGDPFVLPEGATMLDFAFAVHTDLGLRCGGGLVNGRSASAFSTLNWGDTVRIETSDAQQPKKHWLRYVKTYRARRLIRRFLSRSESPEGVVFE